MAKMTRTINAELLASIDDHVRDIEKLRITPGLEKMKAVKVPTLVIHGDEDAIPLAQVREWIPALPDARIIVLEKTGHFPHAEKPDAVFKAIEQFTRERGRKRPVRSEREARVAGGTPATMPARRRRYESRERRLAS